MLPSALCSAQTTLTPQKKVVYSWKAV